MKSFITTLNVTPTVYVTPTKPPSSEWTGKFQVREYSLLFISMGTLLWLLPPLNFFIIVTTAMAVYLIGQSPLTRNQKLVLVLSVLAVFIFLKYQFPRPAIKYVLWGRNAIEAFFMLRAIDFALSKYPPKKAQSYTPFSLTVWDRLGQFLLYIFFFPTVFVGPVISFHDFYKSYQPQISSWFQLVPPNLMKMIWGASKYFILSPYLYLLQTWLEELISGRESHPLLLYVDLRLIVWATFCLLLIRFYLSFSGFTDIAIGLSRLLGFNLYENFTHPLFSTSPLQYWKTSNISTYRWLMTHVFYPFWGHTQITAKVLTTFLVSGLWHLMVTPKINLDAILQLALAFGLFGTTIAIFAKISMIKPKQVLPLPSFEKSSSLKRSLVLIPKIVLTFSFVAFIHRMFWNGLTGKPLEVTLQTYYQLFFR